MKNSQWLRTLQKADLMLLVTTRVAAAVAQGPARYRRCEKVRDKDEKL